MKKNILLMISLVLGVLSMQAQTGNERHAVIPAASPNELTPDFSASPRSGEPPLEVQFTDETEGGTPDSWLWEFGDGDTSNVQNPTHVYDSAGTYSVKLTVTDSAGSYALLKDDYIFVEGAPANCDTLSYPLNGSYTVYISQDQETGEFRGYVSGNNAFNDQAKANYFEKTSTANFLTGVLIDFAIATNASGEGTAKIKAWTGTQSGGPQNQVASENVSVQSIITSIQNEESYYIEFSQQPELTQDFFIGVTLPQTEGDTVVLFTNEQNDAEELIGWEKWDNGSWFAYSDGSDGWGLNIANAIFPVVCESVGIDENPLNDELSVYPNPAGKQLTLIAGNIGDAELVTLYNLQGQMVRAFENVSLNKPLRINISGLDQGVYFLEISTTKGKVTRKIVKNR
ncbi:MAG: T9SS type A sorting domain-containing protein [Bacteroidales bacterium]|nr:T9SS type A sorting domain-containing protein [Bacteroidales bacterium]